MNYVNKCFITFTTVTAKYEIWKKKLRRNNITKTYLAKTKASLKLPKAQDALIRTVKFSFRIMLKMASAVSTTNPPSSLSVGYKTQTAKALTAAPLTPFSSSRLHPNSKVTHNICLSLVNCSKAQLPMLLKQSHPVALRTGSCSPCISLVREPSSKVGQWARHAGAEANLEKCRFKASPKEETQNTKIKTRS